ncbi:MAG TPA: MnhB domain-containing protein [Desulfobacterales bacterium]|nr:MnhB domain-containing protein [Desulfobacterales bacterium]
MNRTEILDVVSRKLSPFIMMFGCYLIVHGHISPGGGFQGGVVLASGAMLLLLGARESLAARLFPPRAVNLVETGGYVAFLAVGGLGMVLAGAFLANVLPTAPSGGLFDAVTVFVLNVVIGLEVGAGVTLACAQLVRGTPP